MAISVGANSAAQRSTQAPVQPVKSKPQSQPQSSAGEVSKTDLAPGLKQAAQLAASAASGQGAAQVATKAVGALVNTKA